MNDRHTQCTGSSERLWASTSSCGDEGQFISFTSQSQPNRPKGRKSWQSDHTENCPIGRCRYSVELSYSVNDITLSSSTCGLSGHLSAYGRTWFKAWVVPTQCSFFIAHKLELCFECMLNVIITPISISHLQFNSCPSLNTMRTWKWHKMPPNQCNIFSFLHIPCLLESEFLHDNQIHLHSILMLWEIIIKITPKVTQGHSHTLNWAVSHRQTFPMKIYQQQHVLYN